jgi:hypothetical protein
MDEASEFPPPREERVGVRERGYFNLLSAALSSFLRQEEREINRMLGIYERASRAHGQAGRIPMNVRFPAQRDDCFDVWSNLPALVKSQPNGLMELFRYICHCSPSCSI